MSRQQTSAGRHCYDGDREQSVQASERLLNDAIVRADLSRSFEEYLEIADRFYDDDVVLTAESSRPPVRGKNDLRSFIAFFLIPLHILAKIGGMRLVVSVEPIASDGLSETHASWTVDLVGVSGKTCTFKWRSQRKWEGSYVVCEHHYDEHQIGEQLTLEDLKNRMSRSAEV